MNLAPRARAPGGRSRDSGQAAVETAIILPLWVFTLLGLVQLTMMHQARILTEYAAYQAARAGVVWNGDPEVMKNAAVFVLAPTACPTRAPGLSAACNFAGEQAGWARQGVGLGALTLLSEADAVAFPGVHVHILNPYWPNHGTYFRTGGGTEMDFDNLRESTRPGPGPDETFENTRDYRLANILTIRVQYWYELKIPFADWVIWYSYLASVAGLSITGAIEGPSIRVDAGPVAINNKSIVQHSDRAALQAATVAAVSSPIRGNELNRGDAYELVKASGLQLMAASGWGTKTYFIPIVTHHSMRMQSNFYKKYIDGGGESRAWE